MYISGFYAFEKRTMQVVGSTDNPTPLSRPPAHTFEDVADKMRNETIVEAPVDPIDENLDGKKVSVTPDLRNYNRREILLSLVQVDELTSPLYASS